MARDVDKVLNVCTQCWRQNASTTKKLPLGTLPNGWPRGIVAMELFGVLLRKKNGNVFPFLITIDHFPRENSISNVNERVAWKNYCYGSV